MELTKAIHKKSAAGLIPEDWELITIENLCKTFTKQTGFDYSNHIKPSLVKKNLKYTYSFIQNKDFDGNYVNYDTDFFIPKNVAENFPMILLDERCLLISISGSIGKVGVFNNKKTAFIGGAVAVGKFKNKEYLNWAMYFLHSEAGQHLMLNDVKAGSHQNLILDDIRKMKIPFPNLQEQKAIAQVLSDTDALIQALEKKIAKKKFIKKGVMQRLLKPKKDWEELLLIDAVDYFHGKAHEQDINENGQYIVVNSKYISTNGKVVKYSSINYCPAKKDDILTVLSDIPNGKALAKCYYVKHNDLYAVNQRICIWRTKNGYSKFLYYILNRNKHFLALNDGVNQTNIGNSDIEKCSIKLPKSIEEQESIANTIDDINYEILILEEKLSKYNLAKKGLMQQLLTGKIRLV